MASDPCDPTQVTTIRSSARKPEIPLVTDQVHKIEAIGKETVAKLKNIRAAARGSSTAQDAVTLQDFTDQLSCIHTGEHKLQTDDVLSDGHKLKLSHHIHDAQNRPVWRELSCVTCT